MTYAMTLDNSWELMTEDEMYDVNGGGTIALSIRISAETIGAAVGAGIGVYVGYLVGVLAVKLGLIASTTGPGAILIMAISGVTLTLIGAAIANAIEDAVRNGQNTATVRYTLASGFLVPNWTIPITL
ncbi:hypothetical protein N7603_02130 [Acholeplasma vituli]|uniref:Uncharacterized protein n=1 Tax=Paracholeplasma vituli TaxID=69473 RepID=A0ABT2PXV2_9MOLU|nr:hypothetical protein [Paracholeplasma vituli]MCU0104453.1 hypothetical protein [Paracholeplasma vituli]